MFTRIIKIESYYVNRKLLMEEIYYILCFTGCIFSVKPIFLTPLLVTLLLYFFFIFCRILALQQIDLWFRERLTEDTYQIIFNFPHRCRKLFSLVLITVRFSSSISKYESLSKKK